MHDAIRAVIEERGLHVFETIDLPARAERRLPLPPMMSGDRAAGLVAAMGVADTVWRHQALALEQLGRGANVLVATGTASGKSLIFQLRALDLILSDPEARVLVFYPLKALAADQHERWLKVVDAAGLPRGAVARIDGDMPSGERLGALEAARLVLMTPDICQAWLMRNLAAAPIKRFIGKLRLFVMDEAHVYESVFGSNVAFLIRRLITAQRRLNRGGALQLLAATATIAFPRDHLCELTGVDFSVIDEEENGAPTQPRTLLHLNGPQLGEVAESNLADLVQGLMTLDPGQRGRFIGFHDSRQGIERIVRAIDDPRVLPYRSGYEAEDRAKIERALRGRSLDGVISTSALELGIDIADMTIGLNLGVPPSRKSLRQRVGRVGRARPGLFLILAPANAFRRTGRASAPITMPRSSHPISTSATASSSSPTRAVCWTRWRRLAPNEGGCPAASPGRRGSRPRSASRCRAAADRANSTSSIHWARTIRTTTTPCVRSARPIWTSSSSATPPIASATSR